MKLSETDKRFRSTPFVQAECDACGDQIEKRSDQIACRQCSGYFHRGDCYIGHMEKQHYT